MADIVEKLRGTLPVCPFDRRSPDYWTAGEGGKPCHVCGTTEDGPDKCRGADTRCMDEAADTITALRDRVAEVERERDNALGRARDYDKIADRYLREKSAAAARATAAEAAIARLRDALEPFAADTLPNSRKIRIAYNRHGLRCAMSDLDIARDNALRALNRDTHHETR